MNFYMNLKNELSITLKIIANFILIYLLIVQPCQAIPLANEVNFFTEPDMVMAKISPNGHSIVTIRYQEDQQQNLTLINTDTFSKSVLLDLKEVYKKSASISKLVWIDEQHIAAQLVETKKGIEDLLDTKSSRRLIIIKIPTNNQKAKVFSVRNKGWLVDGLSRENGVFLYAKSGLYSKVYKINVNKLAIEGKKLNKLSKVDGGQFKASNEVKSIAGYAIRWFFDVKGSPVAVLHFNEKRQLTLSSYADKQVSVLKTWLEEDYDKNDKQDSSNDISAKKLVPMEFSGNENSFYCLDFNEKEKRTVYLVNYKTGQEKIIYEADSYEIISLELAKETSKLTSVRVINNGDVESVFIDNTKIKNKKNPTTLNTQINASLAGDKAIVYRESHTNAGQFYLQSKTGKDKLIGEKYPHITNQVFSKLVELSLNVEGLEIPYLLSLPTQGSKPYPLIVMPHGGPIGVFDRKYYDPIVQFLIARGYGVLQVNYRGSGGYSHKLKMAGKDQWGDLMLEDIYQATLVVAARTDIDQHSICSFGMSYGGYAALMLTIKHPEIYKCAANWAGVTDLNLYVNNPRLTNEQKKWIKKNVGILDWKYEQLKDISPIYLMSELKTPVFIAHGRKDQIVDIEHGYRAKLMLEKYQKTFLWYEDEEGTHSFGSYAQQSAFFERLKVFLATYI